MAAVIGSERDRSLEKSINGPSKYIDASGLLRDHEQLFVSPDASGQLIMEPSLTIPQYT